VRSRLGVAAAIIVGSGLIGLIFYSSRRGYDEAPQLESRPAMDRDTSAKV